MRQLDHRALSVPAAAARPHKPSSAASFTWSNAYAAGWVLIGAGACAYLVALGFMPELVGAGDSAGQQRPGEALSREVAALKEKVTTLSSELGDVKSTLAQIDERERGLVQRIAAAEAKSDGAATAAAGTPVRPAARPKVVSSTAKSEAAGSAKSAARIKTGSIDPATAPGDAARTATAPGDAARTATPPALPPEWRNSTRLLNADPAGSMPAPAPASKSTGDKSAAETPKGQVGIQLATGPSVDSLRLSWSLLNDRHRGVLRSLEPRAAAAGDGTVYQLVARPIANYADAQRICAELHAKGVACRPTTFSGSGL